MPEAVKLSSPATKEFWEIPVLFEDEDLLALDKPADLAVSPDPNEPKQPSLIGLAHGAIERGLPWAKSRGLTYLMNAHCVDAEASGVLILVKNKEALVALSAQFSTQISNRKYVVLCRGTAPAETFSSDAKLAPHPLQMGVVRVDAEEGKKSHTDFTVRERFKDGILIEAAPVPDREHQVRVHLKYLRLPVVGDGTYGAQALLLSRLKPDYSLKPGHEERPLIGRAALHLEKVEVQHPRNSTSLVIEAPLPKDLAVSIKYLRRYATA